MHTLLVLLLQVIYFIDEGSTSYCYPNYCQNKTEIHLNPGEICAITPIKRGGDCLNLRFEHIDHIPPEEKSFDDVSLEVFVQDFGPVDGKATAFNLSFAKVDFQKIITRYQAIENEEFTSACRQIEFSQSTLGEFFISCPFADHSFEETPYRLEYMISFQNYIYSRKLVFIVPNHRLIDDIVNDITLYQPFIYVDVSDPSLLNLNIQSVPEKFSVHSYRVWMFNIDSNKTIDIILEAETNQKHLNYNFLVENGLHYFKVAALHTSCSPFGCFNSTTPIINISQKSHRLLIMIISTVWIPPVIIFALYHMYKCLKRKEMLKRRSFNRPKCLLIYSPTHMSHVNAIIDLTRFLRLCNIEAMIDTLDIPETLHKDPVIWCTEAFHSADLVFIATSPNTGDIAPVIYRNMDSQAMRLLKESYPIDDKKYYVIQLPYCKSDDVPPEARHFKKFVLPEELSKLVKTIHNSNYDYHYFKINDSDLIDSIKLAKMQVVPAQKNKKQKVMKEELLLPEINTIDTHIKKNADLELKNINDAMHKPTSSVTERSYRTNVEELNLLGDCNEEAEHFDNDLQRTTNVPVGFRIDSLNL